MTTTAEFLAEKIKKTFVLTGAMIPIKFGSSDVLINLDCAVAFVQTLHWHLRRHERPHFQTWKCP